MKYINVQRHKMSCGAIAFINYLKFVGNWNATNKQVVELRNAGFWDKECGMDVEVLKKLLVEHGAEIYEKTHKSELYENPYKFYILFEMTEYGDMHVFSAICEKNGIKYLNKSLTFDGDCSKIEEIWEVS